MNGPRLFRNNSPAQRNHIQITACGQINVSRKIAFTFSSVVLSSFIINFMMPIIDNMGADLDPSGSNK